MIKNTVDFPEVTIGLDLGDRSAHAHVMDGAGEWLGNRSIPMTEAGVRSAFGEYPGARVVIESS